TFLSYPKVVQEPLSNKIPFIQILEASFLQPSCNFGVAQVVFLLFSHASLGIHVYGGAEQAVVPLHYLMDKKLGYGISHGDYDSSTCSETTISFHQFGIAFRLRNVVDVCNKSDGVKRTVFEREVGHVLNDLIFGKARILEDINSLSRTAQPFGNELVPISTANIQAISSHVLCDVVEPFGRE